MPHHAQPHEAEAEAKTKTKTKDGESAGYYHQPNNRRHQCRNRILHDANPFMSSHRSLSHDGIQASIGVAVFMQSSCQTG